MLSSAARRRCLLHFMLFVSCTYHHAAANNRRILHQPLFPLDDFPPTHSPILTPPSYPFTSSPPRTPFFPLLPSSVSPPPPPSPASLLSFPANISSLSVPHSSSKSASTRLIVAAVAAVVAAVAIVVLAVFLHFRRRNRSLYTDAKTQRSDNESSTRTITTRYNNLHLPELVRPSQTSSEFLYLGTLVDAHGTGIDSRNFASTGTSGAVQQTRISSSRMMDSPDLRPLPSLDRYRKIYTNATAAPSKDGGDDEFYSPRVSSIDRDSSMGNGSSSRRAFPAIEVGNLNGLVSSSSSTYSSSISGSVSGSPARSASLSLSPANSLSPIPISPKSPELTAIQATRTSLPSPPSSSLSDRSSRRTEQSSPRISNVSNHNVGFESPERIQSGIVQQDEILSPTLRSPPLRPPPPPPPPPLPLTCKISETLPAPSPPSKTLHDVKPAPVANDNAPLISPLETISNGAETFFKNEDKEFPIKAEEEFLYESAEQNEEINPKPKLKPLHWDKVRASSDREMVWDQLKSSSFKLNEEMIESLFIVNNSKPKSKEAKRWQVIGEPDNGNRVLDPKKAQNVSILLRAFNVTVEEVCDGLLEGNSDILGPELLESLSKMAPTKVEESQLIAYKEDSPLKLGTAEKFLKSVLDIPQAFKRVDAMLYISNFDSEVEYLKKSFETLEAACEELRTSRMFLKLLEAVLKTGNRMNVGTNRGDAHAFKLDTLLKLVDVKGADGKTTLLHFVVQEIIKSEGARLSGVDKSSINDDANCRKLGLQVVSGLSAELLNVKKAAAMDAEMLNRDVLNLSNGIGNITEVERSNADLHSEASHKFSETMNLFMRRAEEDIIRVQASESVALSLVKEITEYFHGNSLKEEAHPFRIFLVVRDFLMILDRVCKEVGMINERTTISSEHKFPVPINPMLQSGSQVFSTEGDISPS